MENTSDSFMPGSLLFCMKSKKSVCYSVADNSMDSMVADNMDNFNSQPHEEADWVWCYSAN